MDTRFSGMLVLALYQVAAPGSQAIQLPQHHRVQLLRLQQVRLHLPFLILQQMR
ncbi:MAG: hypothetical protein RL729_531 [Actinomycetota bacterium]|jgi:hypothetical protein